MTAEELDTLPDVDRLERRLIDGRLVERSYAYRSPAHASLVAQLGHVFGRWEETRGRREFVVCGYGCPYRLRRDPDTFVCFDLSVIPARLKDDTPRQTDFFDGVPLFAAEVVDHLDTPEEVDELRDAALSTGVPVFWVVNPALEVIDEFRPGREARTYTCASEIDLGPVLPGFRVGVREFFDE